MDLVHLVLARQELDWLHKFPKLVTKKRFTSIRRTVFDTPASRSGSYERDCADKGELFRTAFRNQSLRNLRNRAVFLRDSGRYCLFTDLSEWDRDFWYALESGMPLIQARALAGLRVTNSTRKISILENYNDLSSIPWTAQLTKELAAILATMFPIRSHRLAYVAGYVGCDSFLKNWEYNSSHGDNHRCGLAERKLNGEFRIEVDQDLERLLGNRVLMGLTIYMPNIVRTVKTNWSPDIIFQLLTDVQGVMEFYSVYPDLILKFLYNIQIIEPTVVRASMARMQALLERNDFHEAFGRTYLPDLYRYICGYESIKKYDGVKGGPREYDSDSPNMSIQQLVVYEPKDNTILFPLGKASFSEENRPAVTDVKHIKQIGNTALAQLLTGNPYDTERGNEWNKLTAEILLRLMQ